MFEKLDEFGATVKDARRRYLLRKRLIVGILVSGIFCLIILSTLILPIVFNPVVALTPLFTVFVLALAAGGIWMLGRGIIGLIQCYKEWRSPLALSDDSKKEKKGISMMMDGEIAICAGATLIGLAILANYIFDSLLLLEAVFLVTNPLLLICLVAMAGGVLCFTAGYFYHRYENAASEKALSDDEPPPLLAQEKIENKEEVSYSIGNFFDYLFNPDFGNEIKCVPITVTEEQLNNLEHNTWPPIEDPPGSGKFIYPQ